MECWPDRSQVAEKRLETVAELRRNIQDKVVVISLEDMLPDQFFEWHSFFVKVDPG